jgi:hypothetical protein
VSGREGKEGVVEDDVVEVDVGMDEVAVGAVAAAAVGVMAELPAGDADNTVPPPAVPALSHGLGGETDAMELRRG